MQSSFWRDSVRNRRCLVPVTSFYEPNADVKPATWNWFALTGEDPRPLFAFAGLWRPHWGRSRRMDRHSRSPVLLATPEMQDQWIKGTEEEAFHLCKPYPSAKMRLVQTGYKKHDLLS